jgi:hypothetical protein
MVAILDFLNPPKLNIFSQISQTLFDIWPLLAKQHFPCCPPFIFFYYAAIVAILAVQYKSKAEATAAQDLFSVHSC